MDFMPINGAGRRLWRATHLALGLLALAQVLGPGPCLAGWYRGDLHAHSNYSGGDSSVGEVIARAEALGLDFLVITDHDTSMQGIPTHWFDPSYQSGKLLLLSGVEWTTSPGHANLWAEAPFAYDALWQANRNSDPEEAVAAAHAEGALFSINHPVDYLGQNPWLYEEVPQADSIEVWNCMGRLPSMNGWARHYFWDDLLQSGRHIAGVGGSDTHQLEGWQAKFFGLGNPTTWVYTEELSATGILAAIKAGHVAVSYAPEAVRLEFRADGDSDGVYETMIGDTLPAPGTRVRFQVEVKGGNGADGQDRGSGREAPARTVRRLAASSLGVADFLRGERQKKGGAAGDLYAVGVFKNGSLYRVWVVGPNDAVTFVDKPQESDYYRVELAGDPDVHGLEHLLYGRIVAITNPIYAGQPPSPFRTSH